MKYVVNIATDPYDVYIGRGSRWGNPFSHLPNSRALWIVKTREEAIARYADWLNEQDQLMHNIKYLKGKILGCHCAPLPCHGNVLAALANDLPIHE
jgi:uncharacterized protein DUF4326